MGAVYSHYSGHGDRGHCFRLLVVCVTYVILIYVLRSLSMFKVIKKEGSARRGEFRCAHGGVVQTPVFMNVGT